METVYKISKHNLKEDHFIDIISGNASAIPFLLNLYRNTLDENILKFAISLGDELIDLANKDRGGLSWNSNILEIKYGRNLTGFAHGAAGIGYSLLCLYKKTDNKKYLNIANQAFYYENSWFNKDFNNWPDFRNPQNDDFTEKQEKFKYHMAWCHGAPGIGLSRLYRHKIQKDDVYANDCVAAINTVKKTIENDLKKENIRDFCLCHGLFGLADILIYANNILYDEYSENLIAKVANYGMVNYPSGEWPCGVSTSKDDPGLLIGLSGIGLFYLRVYDSLKVPSVLIIDT